MYSIGYLLHWALSDSCFTALRLAMRLSRSLILTRPLFHRAANPVAGKDNLNVSQVTHKPLSVHLAKV
jgi:hypothetical protein